MKILAFAAAREKAGFAEMEIAVDRSETPRRILARVAPMLDPEHLRVALDCEYWSWDSPVGAGTELAIIPPVSGG